MLVRQAALSSLLLLASGANAFFPISQAADGLRETASVFTQHFHYEEASRDVTPRDQQQQQQQHPGIFISIAPYRSSTRYKVRNIPLPPTRSIPLDKRANQYKFVTATAPSQPTSLPVDEDGTDYSYFSKMTVGSNDTELYMLLDTGSAVTWVMADDCTADPCKIHNTFGKSSGSASLQTDGSTFKLDYGSGEVNGTNANDTISFAGLKVEIPIGLAETVSDDFQNYPFDGILGLGRIPINNQPSSTFLQQVARNKLLPSNIFGINLQRNSDGSTDGEINFGAPDPSKYKGDLHWIGTVSDHSFWEITVDDLFVGDKSVGLNNSRSAIIDTGTSYMLIPPNDAKAVFDQIPGSSSSDSIYWNVPCDANANVQVVLGGIGYSISPKDYVGPTSGKRDGSCVSHIVGMAAAGDDRTWLLGDTFLKNVYSVFDADQNRVGFGTKTGSSIIDQTKASSTEVSSTDPTGMSPNPAGGAASSTVTGTHTLPGVGSAGTKTDGTSENGPASSATGDTAAQPTTKAAGASSVRVCSAAVFAVIFTAAFSVFLI